MWPLNERPLVNFHKLYTLEQHLHLKRGDAGLMQLEESPRKKGRRERERERDTQTVSLLPLTMTAAFLHVFLERTLIHTHIYILYTQCEVVSF